MERSSRASTVRSDFKLAFDGEISQVTVHGDNGHYEIGRRCQELGVDTIIVFDVHWLVNSGYHINCALHFKDVYTSNELPHFIKNMDYEYDGNPELGHKIAVPQAAADPRQYSQMRCAIGFGREERKDTINRQIVDRIIIDRRCEAHKDAERFFE